MVTFLSVIFFKDVHVGLSHSTAAPRGSWGLDGPTEPYPWSIHGGYASGVCWDSVGKHPFSVEVGKQTVGI